MKRCLIVFNLFFCTSLFAKDSFQQFADSLAKSYFDGGNGVLVIGVVNNGQSRIFYYGSKSDEKNILPDSLDVFEIGNITETFTSILLANQAIKDSIRIDAKLQDYLKVDVPATVYQPFICKPVDMGTDPDYNSGDDYLRIKFKPIMCLPDSTYEPQPVLLCYLASHTSGFPDLPDNLHSSIADQPLAEYSRDDLYSFLREYHIEQPIGFDYKYSQLGIALLGEAISNQLKKDYEKVLIDEVLDSLNMSSSRITLSADLKRRLLQGHDKKGAKTAACTYKAFAPVLGMHSSPVDMMSFLTANISMKKNYISNVLDYTHNPRLKAGNVNDDMEIALGWKINSVSKKGDRMVWQSGSTNGFSAFIGFVETNHTGVFILSSRSKSVELLGKKCVEELTSESGLLGK